MAGVTEAAATAGTPIGDVLQLGVDSLSLGQELKFTKYVRLVLPVDGFVFLVRADLVTPQQLASAAGTDTFAIDAPLTFTQKGSLHYATDTHQDETETFTTNAVVFTSEAEVTFLNLSTPSIIYLGQIDDIRFSFSARKPFYRQADVWHYQGSTRWSDLASQIIDTQEQLDAICERVVSNSLPIWLRLQGYTPAVALHENPGIVLYPSYLVPRNLAPPYGVVHIEPQGTVGLASAQTFLPKSGLAQLCVDEVVVTLYGYRNDEAMDFIAWVDQFTEFNPYVMGMMNVPVVRDEKKGQVELQAIAMKKTIQFEINYYQFRANDIARQIITDAVITYIPAPL
jgi:hypothetical protein